MEKFPKTLLAALLGSTLFLTACNDDDDKKSTGPAPQTEYFQSETSYTAGTLPANAASVSVYEYLMPSVADAKNLVKASAMIFFPKTAQPADGWRIVVWNHGTVGIGDSCAPSQNPVVGTNFGTLAEKLLAEGYVIVAPDYEGLGTPGIHPYLNLSSAANSAIYAVKAAQQHYDSLANEWVSVGQSQGGHAALAVAEFADQDPNYKATVAAAPASSLNTILKDIAPQAIQMLMAGEQANRYPAGTAASVYADLLSYMALAGVGIKSYMPDFNYGVLMQDRAKAIAMSVEGTTGDNGICLGDLTRAYTLDILKFLQEEPGKTVLDYPGAKADFDQDPVVKAFLTKNQPAMKRFTKPVYVVQGRDDMAVPWQVTEDLVDYSNYVLGTQPRIALDVVDGASHTQAIVKRHDQIITFFKDKLPPQ